MNRELIRKAIKSATEGDIIFSLDQLEIGLKIFPGISKHIQNYRLLLAQKHKAKTEFPRASIIVPVFNAVEYLWVCIRSISDAWTSIPHKLLVVNDGSDEYATEAIRDMARRYDFRVIENPANVGYTKSVNIGLRESSEEYLVVLNSDTEVSDGWLDRLVRCAESAPEIGIVGPLSNAASYQNVPELYQDNRFAVNELPYGMTVEDMARIVRLTSNRIYPRVPVVNGFCYLLKRNTLKRVGLLNEDLFPLGYGEENDFCIRAGRCGFELAVADDTYIFHAKSKSFGAERKNQLSKLGRKNLDKEYGNEAIKEIISQLENNDSLRLARDRIKAEITKLSKARPASDEIRVFNIKSGLRILFLLPCKGYGGGIHSVIQEALGLRRAGIEARVAIRCNHLQHYLMIYNEVAEIHELLAPVSFDTASNTEGAENLVSQCKEYDVIIATIYTSVKILRDICSQLPNTMPAYYIQDYEPFFSEKNTSEYREALASYSLISGIVAFAKTEWLVGMVKKRHGLDVMKVMPSLDHTVYKPWFGREPVGHHYVVAAMIRPATPRRGALRTMEFLGDLFKAMGGKVKIEIFGCDDTDSEFQKLPRNFPFINHGRLRREGVASILSRSTIFLDLSDYQAFGRTGLEAMASGCIPVLPERGGVHEYAKHQENSLIINTNMATAFIPELINILEDPLRVQSMKISAVLTASRYSIQGASISIYRILASEYYSRNISWLPLCGYAKT